MSTVSFTITFPSEAGFIGRQCSSASCGRYFKVHENSLREEMYCPYCGQRFHRDDLFTNDQLKHAEEQGVELAKEYMYGEIDKMFARMSGRFRSGSVRMTHTPIRYRAKPVTAAYREKAVDSELSCPDCSALFQVFGVFGYCPGCRSENQAVYDANLSILRRELAAATDQGRALRHAYSDLVSSFEYFCLGRASEEFRKIQFQDLFEARRAFKEQRGVDILSRLSAGEVLTLRRVFQKRHAHIHNRGIIGERYVRKVPEDAKLLGQPAQLSLEEFEAGAKALRSVIDRIVETDQPAA
jgi:uncharacterized Zn-finger protein